MDSWEPGLKAGAEICCCDGGRCLAAEIASDQRRSLLPGQLVYNQFLKQSVLSAEAIFPLSLNSA